MGSTRQLELPFAAVRCRLTYPYARHWRPVWRMCATCGRFVDRPCEGETDG